MLRAAYLIVGLLLPISADGQALQISGYAIVIDGDTIDIGGTRIRLFGIDAPEGAQHCRRSDNTEWDCAVEATLALRRHVSNRPVSCIQRHIDRYGRSVCQCTVEGEDINAWLVANGWALAYRRYSREYVRHESEAQAAHRGIWAGDFEMPWDWRRRMRNGR